VALSVLRLAATPRLSSPETGAAAAMAFPGSPSSRRRCPFWVIFEDKMVL